MTNHLGAQERANRRRAWMVLGLLVPVPTLAVWVAMFGWPGTPGAKLAFILAKIWLVLLPAWWWLRVERGRWSWSRPTRGGFGVAAALGLLMALAVVGAYLGVREAGWIDPAEVVERARASGLSDRGLYLGGALYWITLNSLMEEVVWRWFVFRQCETLWGTRIGVAAAAGAFTLHHVLALAAQFPWPAVILGSGGVFLGGVIWSWIYQRYRSIWPAYVSHAIVDVPIFVIGYRIIFAG